MSVSHACRTVSISRPVYYYQPDVDRDNHVIAVLLELCEKYPGYGFGKLFAIIRRLGHRWNHKRIHRVYCLLKLNMRRKAKKRLPSRNPLPISVPESINQCWSIDFMSDSLYCGRKYRTFNVVDDFNREALAIEVDLNLPAARIIRVLDRIASWREYPAKLRMDNGPEFISVKLADWAEYHNVELEFIQPGKPFQNSYVERFNRTFRNEVLDRHLFFSLSEVREEADRWMVEYNTERPHDSLGKMTPEEYAERAENSKYLL